MTFEELPDPLQQWLELTPIEPFRQSEKRFAQYPARGEAALIRPDKSFFTTWKHQVAFGRGFGPGSEEESELNCLLKGWWNSFNIVASSRPGKNKCFEGAGVSPGLLWL